MTYTDQQINDEFNNLPEEVQDFIMDDYRRELIEKIAENYAIADRARFRKEVFMFQIGLVSVEEFTTHLKVDFGKSEEDADDILIDFNDAVLDDLNDVMRYSDEMDPEYENEEEKETPIQLQPENKPEMPRKFGQSTNTPVKTEALEAYEAPRMPIIPPKTQAAVPLSSNILESKLQGTTNLPKVEENLDVPPAKPSYPGGRDPYREPIE